MSVQALQKSLTFRWMLLVSRERHSYFNSNLLPHFSFNDDSDTLTNVSFKNHFLSTATHLRSIGNLENERLWITEKSMFLSYLWVDYLKKWNSQKYSDLNNAFNLVLIMSWWIIFPRTFQQEQKWLRDVRIGLQQINVMDCHDSLASSTRFALRDVTEFFNYEFISSNFNIRFLCIPETYVAAKPRPIERTIYLTYTGNIHKLPRYGSTYMIPLVITVESYQVQEMSVIAKLPLKPRCSFVKRTCAQYPYHREIWICVQSK